MICQDFFKFNHLFNHLFYTSSGIMTAATKYNTSPVPTLHTVSIAAPRRINVGSTLKYSPIPAVPPQTNRLPQYR